MAVTFSFDCWIALWRGPWVDRIQSALIIILMYAVASILISGLLPQEVLAVLNNWSAALAALITGLLSVIKVSQ